MAMFDKLEKSFKIYDMKKFLTLALMVAVGLISLCGFGGAEVASALESGLSATVIASRCEIYEGADFSSPPITDNDGEKIYLWHGDKVTIMSIQGDWAGVRCENQREGFVYKYYLTQNTSQVVYPVFNASVLHDEAVLYDMDYADTTHRLQKGDRVLVYQSFNEKETYTAVQVVLADGSLYNGYMLTKDVSPDGISGVLIAGITIIIALVTIVLSIVYIKKKKKK